MPNISDGCEALNLLKAHLQSRIDADYQAPFARYNGADVVTADEEPSPEERIGKPYIVFDEPQEQDAPDWGRDARAVLIPADVVATEESGAKIGMANPVGADTLLSSAFLEIVRDDYAVLRDIGLMGATARKGSGRNQDGTHTNTHEFRCVIFPQ